MKILVEPPKSYWRFAIRDVRGRIRARSPWTLNLNVTEGALFLSDVYYGTAYAPYTAAWYVGICGPGAMTPALTDTAAGINTTNLWTEITAYVAAGRQPVTWGTPVPVAGLPWSGLPAIPGSVCSFVMTASGVLQGGILNSNGTKGGTSGKLYAVDNGAGGLPYAAGETVTVQVTTGFVPGGPG